MRRITEWYRQRTLVQRGLVAGALLLSLSVPALALAQDTTGTPPATDDTTTVTPGLGRGFGFGMGDFGRGMGRHVGFGEGYGEGWGEGLGARFGEMMGSMMGRGMIGDSMMRGGRMHGGMMRGGMEMRMMAPPSGTVSAVSADEITVEVTGRGETLGRNREWLSVEATLQIDEETLVFANDLSATEFADIGVADIEVGATVSISPRFEWGQPVAQLIYIGTGEELAEHTFSGRLVSVDGNVLQLEERIRWAKAADTDETAATEEDEAAAESEALTVVTDADTIWYDAGTVGRPDELATGTSLHVLGVQGEDGEVQAVLITAGGPFRGR